MSDYKVWLHLIITLAGIAPGTVYALYAPSIIATFGYDKITANAMACPKGTFKCKGYCQETCDLEK